MKRPSDKMPGNRQSLQQPLMAVAPAISRGLSWMLAMQNRDGGWGAFDRNNDQRIPLTFRLPIAMPLIDPSTPDLAGRVLESLGRLGRRLGDKAVDRAVGVRSQIATRRW